ncbi:MAG: FAD-dependent oxidoreductase [Acidobacteria bacterium]|nr:MAG: FAD-dependent oxidoreductase [Acidobacteriota bacterium]
MRIAVVGSGVSGLVAAHMLARHHGVTVFEKSETVGGHVRTIDVDLDGVRHPVDTGFVVYNETTYPGFVRLLAELGVHSRPTAMSFGVRCERTGLEYCGTSPATLLAQPANLLRPRFWRLVGGILAFNRRARRLATRSDEDISLGELAERTGLRGPAWSHYVRPLVSAIWSTNPDRVESFPTAFFLRFAERHRLLQVRDQLRWRVVEGGSRSYVERLIARLPATIRTRCPVVSIERGAGGVSLRLGDGSSASFDRVVIASHSDEALAMLSDPSSDEREILGAIRYQHNDAVLHTDTRLLPRAPRARANWNYLIPEQPDASVVTTYDMTGLQGLATRQRVLVTLNDGGRVRADRVIERLAFSHPVYDGATVAAQARRREISGVRRTHYCGAYWGFGFHEDGLQSALRACAEISGPHEAAA